MKTITLEIENNDDYQQILDFAKNHVLGSLLKTEKVMENTDIQNKLTLFEKMAGTIKNKPVISLEALRRENLYD